MSSSRRLEEKRYIREIERHFLKRRGSPLLLSPRDWALAVSWFEQGIPLSVVIGAVDDIFDRRLERGETRTIRSLSYCQSEVEERWEDLLSGWISPAATGASTGGDGERAARGLRLAAALAETSRALRHAAAALAQPASGRLERAALEIDADCQRLAAAEVQATVSERLSRWDAEIASALLEATPEAERTSLEREAAERLAPHRRHMAASIYRETLARAVEQRIREHHSIPRLSVLLLLD